MIKPSLKRWLLINYAGYPFAPNSLLPDNGLASLAALIRQQNGYCEILDYSSVSMIAQMTPVHLVKILERIWAEINSGNQKVDQGHLGKKHSKLIFANQLRMENQKRVIEEISHQINVKIHTCNINAIGFKLWIGDGYAGSLEIAKHIRKEYPHIKIFGGGPQVDIFMEQLLLKENVFDGISFGDGEETIIQLFENGNDIKYYDNIPNLIYFKKNVVVRTISKTLQDLNALPIPEYSSECYPAMQNDNKIKIFVIDESRGCENKCAFCIHPIKSNNVIREKSVDKVFSEMRYFNHTFGISTFRFGGSCTPYKLLLDISEKIAASKIKYEFSSFASLKNCENVDFEKLKKGGCTALFFGVESGSPLILKTMHKMNNLDNLKNIIKNVRDAGIFAIGSFIFPSPGETLNTERETSDLILSKVFDAIAIQAPIVTPRTLWFDKNENYDIHIKNKQIYIDELLNWKVRFLFPAKHWDYLPIKINGNSYENILMETTRFVDKISSNGIDTNVSDDLYLISRKAGMNVHDFCALTRRLFFTGAARELEDLVCQINSNKI